MLYELVGRVEVQSESTDTPPNRRWRVQCLRHNCRALSAWSDRRETVCRFCSGGETQPPSEVKPS